MVNKNVKFCISDFFTLIRDPKNRPVMSRQTYWRDITVVILAIGMVVIAINDQNFRQPFYVMSASILSTYFANKRGEIKESQKQK